MDYLEDAQKLKEVQSRFWSKVNKLTESGCWEWTGSVNLPPVLPYGRFTLNGVVKAHRVSWILEYGKIPDGLCVCHKCDNPRCVRPDHLFLGTHKDNQQDCLNKGRHVVKYGRQPGTKFGVNAPSARLTEPQVLEIRSKYAISKNRLELARKYNITPQAIGKIVNRKSWTHL